MDPSSLRIALVSSDFPPRSIGGIGKWAFGVTQSLVRQGHRVTVYTQADSIGHSKQHESAPYRVVKMCDFEWRRLRSTWLGWYNARIVFGGRFDVLIATHWVLGSAAVYLSRFRPLKTVLVLHGTEVGRKRNWLEHRRFVYALNHASLAVAVSNATKQKTIAASGVSPDRIRVIYNGAETGRFFRKPPREDLLSRHGIRNRRVIFTIARVAERKGHDTVIRALPLVRRKHPDAVYLIVGGGGPEMIARLKEIAAAAGVADHVIFAGRVPEEDIVDYFNLGEVFALVSRDTQGKFEGFGISLVEAGACEKPVVAGRSGGIPEVVEDGVSGWLVDPASPEEVADRIVRILDDPAAARAMGKAARERVERLFTWETNVRRLVESVRE